MDNVLKSDIEAGLSNNQPSSLDGIVASMCFCKLCERCPDKNDPNCLRHRNLYQEFMLAKHG